ncbi:MFS transporter [Leptospira sp. 96542]|nr:MFS transporter [Leptospira sp. 96542]
MNPELQFKSLKPNYKMNIHKTVSENLGFKLVAFAFTITMFGSTLPTPLYVLYQKKLGFATFTSSIIFSAYSIGVLVALVILGRLSDTIGRRPTLLLGLLFSTLSSIVFLYANSLSFLIVGRILSGLSAGVFTGTASATIVDLNKNQNSEKATLVATMANMGGLGLGPLVAGSLAQLTPGPLHIPFVIHLSLLVISIISINLIPETVENFKHTPFRVSKLILPQSVREVFFQNVTPGFAGFAVMGLFTAIAPLFLSGILGHTEPVLSGTLASTLFIGSLFGQLTLTNRFGKRAMPIGCGILIAGMVFLGSSLRIESIFLILMSGIISGVGQGVIFRAGLASVNQVTLAKDRAGVVSSFFFIMYLAISIPILGVGFFANFVGLAKAGISFSIIIALLCSGILLRYRKIDY